MGQNLTTCESQPALGAGAVAVTAGVDNASTTLVGEATVAAVSCAEALTVGTVMTARSVAHTTTSPGTSQCRNEKHSRSTPSNPTSLIWPAWTGP